MEFYSILADGGAAFGFPANLLASGPLAGVVALSIYFLAGTGFAGGVYGFAGAGFAGVVYLGTSFLADAGFAGVFY